MPIKRLKDYTNLLYRTKINFPTKHYADVFIWRDEDSMARNIVLEDDTIGAANICFTTHEYNDEIDSFSSKPKIAELHFTVNFGIEMFSHEMEHLLLHYRKVTNTDYTEICREFSTTEQEYQCYMVSNIYKNFWNWYFDKGIEEKRN